MPVLLMRHAETDWPLVDPRGWPGGAVDLAPLTPTGVDQAQQAARDLTGAGTGVTRVRSSPMTRALQTAAIVSAALGVTLSVDLDLHEWLPDERFTWTSETVLGLYDDMLAHAGVRPDGHPYPWEPLAHVRHRALAVLRGDIDAPATVLAVTHEVTIHALTGEQHTGPAATRALVSWS